jgi:hypothetical protein
MDVTGWVALGLVVVCLLWIALLVAESYRRRDGQR